MMSKQDLNKKERLIVQKTKGLEQISNLYFGLKIQYKAIPKNYFKNHPIAKIDSSNINKTKDQIFTAELKDITKSVLDHKKITASPQSVSLISTNSDSVKPESPASGSISPDMENDLSEVETTQTNETQSTLQTEAIDITDITKQVLSEMDELEQKIEPVLYIEDFDYERFESQPDDQQSEQQINEKKQAETDSNNKSEKPETTDTRSIEVLSESLEKIDRSQMFQNEIDDEPLKPDEFNEEISFFDEHSSELSKPWQDDAPEEQVSENTDNDNDMLFLLDELQDEKTEVKKTIEASPENKDNSQSSLFPNPNLKTDDDSAMNYQPETPVTKNLPVDWMSIKPDYLSQAYDQQLIEIYQKKELDESDFDFFMKKIKDVSQCNAAAILLYNDQLSVYQRLIDTGLDKTTSQNLYFGYDDVFLSKNTAWQKLDFNSELSHDFNFQKRMSSGFFHSNSNCLIYNFKDLGYDGYLIFFFEKKSNPDNKFLEQALFPILTNLLPATMHLARQKWYSIKKQSNPSTLLNDKIYYILKKISRGGRKKINIMHAAFDNILELSNSEIKIRNLFIMVKNILPAGSEFILLAPHKCLIIYPQSIDVNFESMIQDWAQQESVLVRTKNFKYPDHSNNLYNFISPSW